MDETGLPEIDYLCEFTSQSISFKGYFFYIYPHPWLLIVMEKPYLRTFFVVNYRASGFGLNAKDRTKRGYIYWRGGRRMHSTAANIMALEHKGDLGVSPDNGHYVIEDIYAVQALEKQDIYWVTRPNCDQ